MNRKEDISIFIPFPSIQEEDNSYYIDCIIKWLYKDEIKANTKNDDIVNVFYDLDIVFFKSGRFLNLIRKFEFPPIERIKSDEELELIYLNMLETDLILGVSRQIKFLLVLLKLIVGNIIEFLTTTSKHLNIPYIIGSEGHEWELLLIPKIIKDLEEIIINKEVQLIPNLYCHLGRRKLFPFYDYDPPKGGKFDEPDCVRYTFEFIFSKFSSDMFTRNLIESLKGRLKVLKGIYQPEKIKNGGQKPYLKISIQSIEDIIIPDHVKEFYKIEKSFVEAKYILKKGDNSLQWILKPKFSLIAFIYILLENGYINGKKIEKYRTQCKRVIEERYNILLGQSFEKARIQKQIDRLKNYKTFLAYRDIKPVEL